MATETTRQTTHQSGRTRKSITRYLPTAARLLLGLIFLVMGLNGYLNFLPQPSTPVPERAVAFLGALYATGYMVQMVSGVQVIVGVLLLTNRFVPLALTLIAPVIVNIGAVHLFLAPAEGGPAIVVFVLELYLAWAYRESFRPMLAMRASPTAQRRQSKLAPTFATRRGHHAKEVGLQMDDWFEASDASGARGVLS